jgi:hypothetical protein
VLNSSVSNEPIDHLCSASQKRKNDDEIEQSKHFSNRRRREISNANTNNDKEFSALQTVFLNIYKDKYNLFVKSILDNSEASVKKAALALTSFVSNKSIFLYKNNLEAYVYIEDTNVKMQDNIEWRKSYIRWLLSVTKS